jgi:hypothetical protein
MDAMKKARSFPAEVVAAFRQARQLYEADADSEAINAACIRLHQLLGRASWAEDVMDVDQDTPPGFIGQAGEGDAQNARTWAEARKLRLELERAAT